MKPQAKRPDLNSANFISNYATKPYSKKESYIIIEQAKKGNIKAQEDIIRSNLGLVMKVAKRYMSNYQEFNDLIQEGNLGLLKAIEKFDISKGFAFSTYAIHWVRSYIQKASNSKQFFKSLNKQSELFQLQQIHENLSKKSMKEPTLEEITKEMNRLYKKNITIDYISQLLEFKSHKNTISLDAPLKNSDGITSLIDVISDPTNTTPETIAIQQNTYNKVMECMQDLNSRELNFICQRYAVGEYNYLAYPIENNTDEADNNNTNHKTDGLTLEKIGENNSLTRERVRQIVNKGIDKLKEKVEA